MCITAEAALAEAEAGKNALVVEAAEGGEGVAGAGLNEGRAEEGVEGGSIAPDTASEEEVMG